MLSSINQLKIISVLFTATAQHDGSAYSATFKCNLSGRFVTLQRYSINYYTINISGNTNIFIYSYITISEISFYATL